MAWYLPVLTPSRQNEGTPKLKLTGGQTLSSTHFPEVEPAIWREPTQLSLFEYYNEKIPSSSFSTVRESLRRLAKGRHRMVASTRSNLQSDLHTMP